MSFQTFNPSLKYAPRTPKPASRVPLGAAGQVADHQPCWLPASVGQESTDKENAPLHEYGVQPTRRFATNSRLRVPAVALNNAGTITASACSRVSPRKKAARPALLVPPFSPSSSSPTEPTTPPPKKLVGKRTSPSDDFAGPSSSPKKARSAPSHSGPPSGSNSRPITPPPTRVSARDIAASSRPSLEEARPDTPESVLSQDNQTPMQKLREQYIIEATNTSHQLPSEHGDERRPFNSDPSNARGGRENGSAATMATRIAEVHKLEDHYVDLMAKLHCIDQTEDCLVDNELEDNFAAAKTAYNAWQGAKLRLSSPASALPSTSTTPASTMSLPALNSVSGGYGDSNMIGVMREPYLVLLAHLDSTLPKLPVVATNTSDAEVETIESADAYDEEPTIPDTSSSPLPSEDPQSTTVSLSASSTPSSEPTSAGVQSELPESELITPSASSTPLMPQAPVTSFSVASTASAPFRFSQDDEALLLGHTRAKRYTEATDMLPQDQQWKVITTPAEITAVRLVHPRKTARPTNKGKRADSYQSRNRKTRSHIGEDGAETELWVCRASFKVDEGGVSYLGSPCGMPVGTKDSWKRHLKEKHFGREKRN